MRVFVAFLLAVVPSFAPADICRKLDDITRQAEGGFPQGQPVDFATDATGCALAQQQGGRQTYLCHWQFDYRDKAATDAFSQLDTAIQSCRGGLAPLPRDTAVNHPDSYDLHRYRHGNSIISLALKDKAELAQSLLFLRIDAMAE